MKLKFLLFLTVLQLSFSSCATYYDHYTFTETLATQVMTRALIEKANTPFAENALSVEALQQQLKKMMQYETLKNKDAIMQKMWQQLNRDNSALQNFIKTWEAQGTMSQPFIDEFAPQISKQFDLMVTYESKKDRKTGDALLSLLKVN
ncbi:MAG: hypothetical protein ACPG7E_08855 [Marinirhabdus sp.]